MIRRICFLAFFAAGMLNFPSMAQPKNDYEKIWKKVNDLDKKGLTGSALKELSSLFGLAAREKNDPQLIKAALYQLALSNKFEEDSPLKNIHFIDSLVQKTSAPAKNILYSLQGELLWHYLQNNRWKFYNRTKVENADDKDISTWTLDQLHATIILNYKLSLSNTSLLKSTRLEGFEPILIKGKNTRQLRPTLFDFIAHRALEFYKTDENYITAPAYQFRISDKEAFGTAGEFSKFRFATKDTASLLFNALQLMQELTRFHLGDKQPDALLETELMRLGFVYEHAVNDDKTEQYEKALQAIEMNYPASEYAAEAMFRRATIYREKGDTYVPFTNTTHQYEIKRAKELCEQAIARYPGSEGGIHCQNLLQEIRKPSLGMQVEKVNLPETPVRAMVQFRNVNTIYLRLIRTSRDEIKKMDRYDLSKFWRNLTSLKAEKEWSIQMPDLKDFQNHSAEIKVEGMPAGTYFLLAGLNPNFSTDSNIMLREVIHFSNISLIHSNNDYYVLHRNSGQPLALAKVQLWESKYNYRESRHDETKAENYTTDNNGHFRLKEVSEYRNILFQLKAGKEELFLDENNYQYRLSSYEENDRLSTYLFTDRSIYRPGQTVYFKGIVINRAKEPGKTAVKPGFKTNLILYDVNHQLVSSMTVNTNDYGSFKGSFKIPEGLLNGRFSIFEEKTATTHYFNVEEYKRPKFAATIEKPAGTYRLNDTITVKGNALAYAGNVIDGAEVSYRVVRKTQYPSWWYWGYYRRGGYGRSEEMEITNGETTTNEKGEFTIRFKAIPDETTDPKEQPVFNYEINVDVTDINGETRSAETNVAVAYQSLQLEIKSPSSLEADQFQSVQINSTNLNDVFEATKVELNIFRLQSPNRIFRERYWNMPDLFTMSRDEYYQLFPYDVYKDEDKTANWPLAEKAYSKTDSTSEKGQWAISSGKWEPGWYKIIATTRDKYGQEVKAEKFIRLNGSTISGSTVAARIVEPSKALRPGEKMSYRIETGFEKVWMIHTLTKMDKRTDTSYATVKKDQPFSRELLITEQDRGGIALGYVFVQHNSVYSGTEGISIPWTNKDLQISFGTYRDKLLPGSKEKWTVTIRGSKGEKVNAELLTALYDASLDQFEPQSWSRPDIWPLIYNPVSWQKNGFNAVTFNEYNNWEDEDFETKEKSFDRLGVVNDDVELDYSGNDNYNRPRYMKMAPPSAAKEESKLEEVVVTGNGNTKDKVVVSDSAAVAKPTTPKKEEPGNVQVRKNFNETAFFFPDLKTDSAGNISFEFTIPEALTKWKWMLLAHDKDMAGAYTEKTIVTQKPLMVQPNAPRFMREGDQISFSAKIANLEKNELQGTATLELLDAATNEPVDALFNNRSNKVSFSVKGGQSVAISFPLTIPFNFNRALLYRIKAAAQSSDGLLQFSDGEEMALPVLTNRMLVTESLPLSLRNQQNKTYRFDKLLNSDKSKTISHQALTVEYTSNPVWYAVQALPYLMEYPYECAEQTFNRYYANALATHISDRLPKIKSVFEQWKNTDTAALLSNLQKNEELKYALLQETPWVLEAQDEAKQKKNIALLFDLVKMSRESAKAIAKLKEMQSENGGFVWFKGGPDDRYITQYILTGIGHLVKLGVIGGKNEQQNADIKTMVEKALPYLDRKLQEEYEQLLRYKVKLKENHLSYTAIQYLYMRSFFSEKPILSSAQKAYTYYREQSAKWWLTQSRYMQAMIALALHRTGNNKVPKAIIRSLKENAINKEELGMYWKEWNAGGYYWYQSPIESQALMIEAFRDVANDTTAVNDLSAWLLKQKQTQNWKTTKATAEACYALLLGSGNTLIDEVVVSIRLGDYTIRSTESGPEAGTGYIKKRIEGKDVYPRMGDIKVSIDPSPKLKANIPPTWGSVYWQYFEDLDKITPAATPLQLEKKLFIEQMGDKGLVLKRIKDGDTIKVGDKVKVRITLRVDRAMEYVHMKDMRGSCMEPVNVTSEYKWQDGLGYYESTKDASTNFFFGWLPRGTYVFEYPLFVTHAGNFSNGITTIQCMYAPEFSSHSEGVRVNVAR